MGRSPADTASLEDLREVLAAHPATECHLVLSSPTRDSDQKRVLDNFMRFEPRSLIFTKLDETTTFGPILNRIQETGLAVSYLATGQKVPDDLEQAKQFLEQKMS